MSDMPDKEHDKTMGLQGYRYKYLVPFSEVA